jgi:hypothetical protein
LTMNVVVNLINKELAKGLKYTILSSTPMSPPHLHRDVFFWVARTLIIQATLLTFSCCIKTFLRYSQWVSLQFHGWSYPFLFFSSPTLTYFSPQLWLDLLQTCMWRDSLNTQSPFLRFI